ncbi:MAG: hypothetical protein WKF75_04335 [Singulisphaera sp.]
MPRSPVRSSPTWPARSKRAGIPRRRTSRASSRRCRDACGHLRPRTTPPGRDRQRARLAGFEPSLTGGDPSRGRAVFFGKKVACSSCHAIGRGGVWSGPTDADRGHPLGRDILESILLPSSTFAQGYENFLVATDEGRLIGGVVARQTADTLVLRDSGGGETRLRKDRIQDMDRQAMSIMPEGLERA